MAKAQDWQGGLRGVAEAAERELKAAINYVDTHIVPRVRVEAAGALHSAAGELRRLAGMLEQGQPAATRWGGRE